MNTSMTPADIPAEFQLRLDHCRCQTCGHNFVNRISVDDVLVKFIDESGLSERWLPTFENGGYLELMEKLVPGFVRNMPITMKVFNIFEREFRNIQEPPESGGYWIVAAGCFCPKCKSKSVFVDFEKIVNNPQVEWMSYRIKAK